MNNFEKHKKLANMQAFGCVYQCLNIVYYFTLLINLVTVVTLLVPAGYHIINNIFCLDDFSEELDYLFEIIYLYSINSICIFACISFTLIDDDLKSTLSLMLENFSIIMTALKVILANLVSAIVNLLSQHIPLISFLTNQAENAAAHTPFV